MNGNKLENLANYLENKPAFTITFFIKVCLGRYTSLLKIGQQCARRAERSLLEDCLLN